MYSHGAALGLEEQTVCPQQTFFGRRWLPGDWPAPQGGRFACRERKSGMTAWRNAVE